MASVASRNSHEPEVETRDKHSGDDGRRQAVENRTYLGVIKPANANG